MKHCKYCNVDVQTNEKYCPLCYNMLEGNSDNTVDFYQKRKEKETTQKTRQILFKIFFLISLATIAVCVLVNVLTWNGIIWSVLVGVSELYVWILIAHTIFSRRSIFEKVLFQLVGIIAIVVVCSFIAKGDWLLNYVIPSIQLATVTSLAFVSFVMRNRYKIVAPFFIVYIMSLIASIVLLAIRVDTFMILSEINLILCGLAIVGTLIFGHKTLRNELSKKLHL